MIFLFSPKHAEQHPEEGGRELEMSARNEGMEQVWDVALQHYSREAAMV